MSKRIIQLLISMVVCLAAGAAGSFFTRGAIPEWYVHINKPVFNPPDWVFAPVWTMLYTLMGIAAFLVWRKGIAAPQVKGALRVFIFQLTLNVVWSAVFFGSRSVTGGLAVIILLWSAIAWTIKKFLSISQPAAVVLIPYIAWVSFALILNVSLVMLN